MDKVVELVGGGSVINGAYPFYFIKIFGQSGGASRWRVCYQRGLPRLVFEDNTIQPPSSVHEPWCQILFTTSNKNLYYSNHKFIIYTSQRIYLVS